MSYPHFVAVRANSVTNAVHEFAPSCWFHCSHYKPSERQPPSLPSDPYLQYGSALQPVRREARSEKCGEIDSRWPWGSRCNLLPDLDAVCTGCALVLIRDNRYRVLLRSPGTRRYP